MSEDDFEIEVEATPLIPANNPDVAALHQMNRRDVLGEHSASPAQVRKVDEAVAARELEERRREYLRHLPISLRMHSMTAAELIEQAQQFVSNRATASDALGELEQLRKACGEGAAEICLPGLADILLRAFTDAPRGHRHEGSKS